MNKSAVKKRAGMVGACVRPARGFTLVEMIATLSTAAIVLSSVAMTISSLHRVNRKLRDEFPASAAMARFAARLRSDIHIALLAEVTEQGNSGLRLELPDQRTIEYSVESERVFRTVHVPGQPEKRDSFRIPRRCQCGWSVTRDPVPMVRLILDCQAGLISGAIDDRRVTNILATVGVEHGRGAPQ